MRGFNKVILIGNVVQDPKPFTYPNGKIVSRFDMVVDETYTRKDGSIDDISTWVPMVAMGKLATLMGTYIKKGSRLFVEGKYTTAQDMNGNVVHNIMVINYQDITCKKLFKPEFPEDDQTEEDDYGNT